MKILFVTQPNSAEYAISQLFYGAVKLGHEVSHYPFNPFFNFASLEDCEMDCKNGPCAKPSLIGCENHSAHLAITPKTNIKSFLNFIPDITITNNGYGMEMLYRTPIIAKSKIVALDLGDSAYDAYNEWCQCIGRKPDLFLRREHLIGQHGLPFDYSFYDDKLTKRPTKDLIYSIAFMHRPTNPERAMYAEVIKRIPNSIVGEFKYTEYLKILSYSKFAVAMPGAGQTTVRHVEIPGMGAVLCRMPWPKNFSDRETCPSITFNSPEELEGQVLSLLEKPALYEHIRNSSFTYAQNYGTCTSKIAWIIKEIL